MTLQNRVTPFGDIVAIPQRGIFTGNRGIIHDPATRTLLKRRWATKAWLICLCEFKERHREVMTRRSWTELFFLDEAVALAAGHRPCFICRREAAEAFRNAWALGSGAKVPAAAEMDAVLHTERLDHGRKRLHALSRHAEELPEGSIIAAADEAYTLAGGRAFRWTAHGYEGPLDIPGADALVTPPSTLRTLRAGYRPVLHPSTDKIEPASTAGSG
ncbi:MAG: hypothetical protein JO058_19480 [Alphaproteobacteria bacterium]|nr:hypothetical protein [Alphaproteobacteria bacterium]